MLYILHIISTCFWPCRCFPYLFHNRFPFCSLVRRLTHQPNEQQKKKEIISNKLLSVRDRNGYCVALFLCRFLFGCFGSHHIHVLFIILLVWVCVDVCACHYITIQCIILYKYVLNECYIIRTYLHWYFFFRCRCIFCYIPCIFVSILQSSCQLIKNGKKERETTQVRRDKRN